MNDEREISRTAQWPFATTEELREAIWAVDATMIEMGAAELREAKIGWSPEYIVEVIYKVMAGYKAAALGLGCASLNGVVQERKPEVGN
jgi:hypothetical protein